MAKPKLSGNYTHACFAPPLTDELLEEYQALVEQLGASELRDALEMCLTCVKRWWDLPESTGEPIMIAAQGEKRMPLVAMDQSVIDTMDEVTPWLTEVPRLQSLFEGTQGRLRDAAHHLLWHVIEITRDREPCTSDKIS